MSGNYRSIIQTGIIFILANGTGSIIERLIDINCSLRRIENKMNIRESEVYQNYLNKKEE